MWIMIDNGPYTLDQHPSKVSVAFPGNVTKDVHAYPIKAAKASVQIDVKFLHSPCSGQALRSLTLSAANMVFLHWKLWFCYLLENKKTNVHSVSTEKKRIERFNI